MSFTVPTFNTTCNIYSNNEIAPRLVGVPCNLAMGRRVAFPSIGGPGDTDAFPCTMQLLLPALTDIRGEAHTGGGDQVTIAGRIGMFYTVIFADTVAYGFDNEYRIAILKQVGPLPIPFNY